MYLKRERQKNFINKRAFKLPTTRNFLEKKKKREKKNEVRRKKKKKGILIRSECVVVGGIIKMELKENRQYLHD